MARTKATQPQSIEDKIFNKIKSLENELEHIKIQLEHWRKVSADYETNKVTIESILSVHQAPDLSAPAPKKYKTRKNQ